MNELEGIVFKRYPILEQIKAQLKEMGAFYVSMSGSGSSVYALYKERKHAEKVKQFFAIEKEMRTFLCKPLSVYPYSSLLNDEYR